MTNKENVIKGLEQCLLYGDGCYKCADCPYLQETDCIRQNKRDALALLKELEAIKPKTIPEELKLKMLNALYAEEDKFEEKYIGTKEENSWFIIYRPWLQAGFNLAIKAIADWKGW